MDDFYETRKHLEFILQDVTPIRIQEGNLVCGEQLGYDATGADAVCILATCRDAKHIRKAMGTPYSEFQSFALVPNPKTLRWIIPIENRHVASSSMRLYNPQSLKGKLFKYTTRWLSYFGIQRIWGRDRLFISSNADTKRTSLEKLMQDLLEVNNIYLTFSTGTPGYYRKTTIQVMSRDGKALAYAKIGDTPQAKKLLIQEAEMLRHLGELSISTGRIPELIYAGCFKGRRLILQSAPRVRTRSGAKKLGREHIEFLVELFNQTKVQRVFVESEYWIGIKRDFRSLQDTTDKQWQQRIQNGLDICARTLGNEIIPLGACHRDFTPWNTLTEEKHLYVFDWEFAVAEGIPFWDIFHFMFFPAILVKRRSGRQIIDQWMSNRVNQWLKLYAKKIDVDVGLVPAFFLLYFIEVSCFYLDVFHRDGVQDRRREWVRRTWAEALDELAIHWEKYWSQWQ